MGGLHPLDAPILGWGCLVPPQPGAGGLPRAACQVQLHECEAAATPTGKMLPGVNLRMSRLRLVDDGQAQAIHAAQQQLPCALLHAQSQRQQAFHSQGQAQRPFEGRLCCVPLFTWGPAPK